MKNEKSLLPRPNLDKSIFLFALRAKRIVLYQFIGTKNNFSF